MKMSEKLLLAIKYISRFNFGNFEIEEFKKFIRLGLIFGIVIGVHWTLVSLKDSLFIQLVDSLQLPYAKSLTVFFLVPLVVFYNKLFKSTSRDRMMVLVPAFYGFSILGFSILMSIAQRPSSHIVNLSLLPFLLTKALGYFWFVFVESYGSLVIALFWSFATDLTEPLHAKRGFPLIYALGQLGGILIPYSVGCLPYCLGSQTDTISIVLAGILTLFIIPLGKYFLRVTPQSLLTSGYGQKEEKEEEKSKFFNDIKIILKNRYFAGILATIFIYQVVLMIFEFNFKVEASKHYSGVLLSQYFSTFSSSVNIVSLLCLLLGISNISRYLGIRVALVIMPIFMGCCFWGFLTINSLPFLFTLMIGTKAINYALYGPVLKQLYIPTPPEIRFKGQSWIETFGIRVSKQVGSLFNMSLQPFQSSFGSTAGYFYYLMISGFFIFPLIGLWVVVAIFLSKSYQSAIEKKSAVC